MKKETENTLKFKKLKAMAGLATWEAKGLLVALWQFTASNSPRGDLGRFSNEDIAYGIEFPLDRIDGVIAVLVKTAWLDESAEHRLIVHDWSEHCEDAVKMRLQRAGESFADGTASSTTRMAKKERAQCPQPVDTSSARRGDSVPTACARNGDGADGVGTTDTDTDTRTETKPIPIPEPKPGPARVSGSANFDPASVGSDSAYKHALWKRTKAVVMWRDGEVQDGRDPPENEPWWRETTKRAADAGLLPALEEAVQYAADCRDPVVRRAKDLGELARPAAFVASKLKGAGLKLPAPLKAKEKV